MYTYSKFAVRRIHSKSKKVNIIISLAIVISTILSFQITSFADKQTKIVDPSTDMPSSWAVESVNWSSIYELSPGNMFSKYQTNIKRYELYSVSVNLYERITNKNINPVSKSPFSDTTSEDMLKALTIKIAEGKGKFYPNNEVTRLEVATVLYKTLKAAEPNFNYKTNITFKQKDTNKIPSASLNMVKYIYSKEIMKGKTTYLLGVDAKCSRQEMMAFAVRTYEFAAYEAGRDSKGVFWKVSDSDSSVYLMGSVHVADSSMYPISKNVLSAFNSSDILVFEIDLANQTEGLKYMQQKIQYEDDNTLEKNIPSDLYNRFKEAIKPLNISESSYKKLKPWAAAMLVSNAQAIESNLKSSLGIDLYFTNKAAQKQIEEIEGVKFQVDMFDSFSKELQLSYLESVLSPYEEENIETSSNVDKSSDLLSEMITAWKNGDASKLEKLIESDELDSEESKEFTEKIWTTRNDNMTKKVKEYLSDPEKKTYFIVVGAGHMVGKNGIVTQLKPGFRIEQIK